MGNLRQSTKIYVCMRKFGIGIRNWEIYVGIGKSPGPAGTKVFESGAPLFTTLLPFLYTGVIRTQP